MRRAAYKTRRTAITPGVPHQLCQFHDLREAARPVYEADRHAKVLSEAGAAREYGAAVRSALTDDGLDRVARKRGCRGN